MQLYKDYLKEVGNGREILVTDTGFATYQIIEEECYIDDIYVKPKYRKTKKASQIADSITKIAKENNCSILTGSVIPTANNATRSVKVLLGYGFKLLKSDNNTIWFYKEI